MPELQRTPSSKLLYYHDPRFRLLSLHWLQYARLPALRFRFKGTNKTAHEDPIHLFETQYYLSFKGSDMLAEIDLHKIFVTASFQCRAGHCFLQQSLAVSEPKEVSSLTRKQPCGFKLPMKGAAQQQPVKAKPKWVHNPGAEYALILNPEQAGAVPVVVDPYICRSDTQIPSLAV